MLRFTKKILPAVSVAMSPGLRAAAAPGILMGCAPTAMVEMV